MDERDEMIARDCYVAYMRNDEGDPHDDFVGIVGTAIAAAREEGRAAGYAEARGQAAKLVQTAMYIGRDTKRIADVIAALAPATTKEPT